jgi:membrane fusion protein (multidrug efflux system)
MIVKGRFNQGLIPLALTCLLVLAACDFRGPAGMRGAMGDLRTPSSPAAVPVEVMAVSRGDIQRTYRTVTTLEAGAQAEVVARSTGVLEVLMVEEGDYVEQGQALAQLDTEQLELEVAQRRAVVARLRGDLQRTQALFERNLGSATDVDNLRYELESQQAQLDLAELRLRYATVTAPISGIITERLVRSGNMIQTNQVLFRLTDPDSIEAVLHLPQRELPLVAPGQAVWLQMDSFPGQRMSGRVERLRP